MARPVANPDSGAVSGVTFRDTAYKSRQIVLDDGQVLAGLRHNAFVSGHHQQYRVHTRGPSYHLADEPLVSRDVNNADNAPLSWLVVVGLVKFRVSEIIAPAMSSAIC